MGWSIKESKKRIEAEIKKFGDPVIKDLVRETDLTSIPNGTAYRVNGVHVYVDILNAQELLNTDSSESERSHKRYLRFLNIYQRVAHIVFRNTAAIRVDLQNARLHFVVYKPYDGEDKSKKSDRVHHAVAVADLLVRVLESAAELHDELPDPLIRVGIESGLALAVNNGSNGDREPLFLGEPANRAAKLSNGSVKGVFLGTSARAACGWAVEDEAKTPLTTDEISKSNDEAALEIDKDKLCALWSEELKEHPLSEFEFSRPTPPLRSLDFEELTPANSRRIEAVSVFADIDGFTSFVSAAITDGAEKEAVKALHVIRTELRNALHSDFDGRKIRYIGDCLHGILAEGERATDVDKTLLQALLCAGAMRDAFGEIQKLLSTTAGLGLAIGLDFGPVSLTRVGVQGSRVRSATGLAVVESEANQRVCSGTETAIGLALFKNLPSYLQELFDADRKAKSLTFNKVEASVPDEEEEKAALRSLAVAAGPVVVKGKPHSR